jgi:putative transport protein
MTWLEELRTGHTIAYALLVLSAAATLGLGLGKLKIRGIGLGIAGVLFSGILLGHFGFRIDHTILEFAREFGLVLFVYTIGLQVGPGFFTSLRKEGLPLNLMSAAIVLIGAALTLGAAFLFRMDIAAAAGLFAGATTNTPALGAAQQALKGLALADPVRQELPALAYAVAYPFGIIGIILSMILFRNIFRVNTSSEDQAFQAGHGASGKHLHRLNIEVSNANLNGVAIRELPGKSELGVVVSRIRFAGEDEVRTAKGAMHVHVGDVILAVGTREHLAKFRLITGVKSSADLMKEPGNVSFRRVVVTRAEALGRTVAELGFNEIHDVTVTRVVRSGIEMPAGPLVRLQFGDMLQVVGNEEDIEHAAQEVGNSSKALNHTNFVAVFLGVGLGVLLGVLPLHFPGIPVPVRLGIAGGPLLAAILLSQIGRIGPVVWYMPENANIALRELGIVLFLACVGLKAGDRFVEVIVSSSGLLWMGCAAVITILPLLIVGAFGRLVWKLNFMSLCGLLAGSMTDPPALAFANTTAGSDAPAVAYAAVYPLTMFLRIVVAQLIVVLFAH